jgi:putative transposase
MKYNPDIHHRRSIRLRNYDYSLPGAYFVTVCTQDRACLFGNVADDTMRLNDAGRMIEQWWFELNRKFPTVETDEFVVMPNHFHGIVVIPVRGRPACRPRIERRTHRPYGRTRRCAPTNGYPMV